MCDDSRFSGTGHMTCGSAFKAVAAAACCSQLPNPRQAHILQPDTRIMPAKLDLTFLSTTAASIIWLFEPFVQTIWATEGIRALPAARPYSLASRAICSALVPTLPGCVCVSITLTLAFPKCESLSALAGIHTPAVARTSTSTDYV
jgi:hypothetical protein